MTAQKQNTLLSYIRTITNVIIAATCIGIFNYAREINDFMVAKKIKDDVQDQAIGVMRLDVEQEKKTGQDNRNDISTIKAIIFTDDKKKYR